MPFESYKPGKESRDIERAQREHVAGQEVRLGFARSHTETAKPGDTLKGLIKRAYKEGKLYSERQASEAAGQVVERFKAEGVVRVNAGDHVTFANDNIRLRRFDKKNGKFINTRIELGDEQGSLNYKRREIISTAQASRAELNKDIQETSGVSQPEMILDSVEQKRYDAITDFLNNTDELKRLIRVDEKEEVQIISGTSVNLQGVPKGYPGFFFGMIAAYKGDAKFSEILVGVNPREGKVVLYNYLEKKEFARIPWENPNQSMGMLKLALSLLVNPDKK